MRQSILTLLALVLCGVTAAPTWADEAQDAFESLYGMELRQAQATPNTMDDAALAAKLVESAQAAGQSPRLQRVMCQNAYALGHMNAEGMDAAAQAAQMLIQIDSARRAEHQESLISVRQRQYLRARGDERTARGEDLLQTMISMADERAKVRNYDGAIDMYRKAMSLAAMIKSDQRSVISEKLESAAAAQKLDRQVELLRGKLEASPQDPVTAKQLVKLYVVDMDMPGSAATFATLTGDPVLQKMVPLAAADVTTLSENDALELGDWYRTWATQSTLAGKPAMLARAQGYYQRFLEVHTTDDLARTRATLALREVESTLEKLGGAPVTAATPGRLSPYAVFNGRDLRGWKVQGDEGVFKVEDGELVATGDKPGTWLMTEREVRDFILKLEFKVAAGGGGVIGLRVDDDNKHIKVPIMDETAPGAAFIPQGLRSGSVFAKRDQPAQLKPVGEWNTLEIQMKDVTINVKINGQQVTHNDLSQVRDFVRQLGRDRRFSKFSRDAVKDSVQGRIGLESGRAEVRYRNIELKPM